MILKSTVRLFHGNFLIKTLKQDTNLLQQPYVPILHALYKDGIDNELRVVIKIKKDAFRFPNQYTLIHEHTNNLVNSVVETAMEYQEKDQTLFFELNDLVGYQTIIIRMDMIHIGYYGSQIKILDCKGNAIYHHFLSIY